MSDDSETSENCPHMASCEMYQLFQHTGTLGAWQALYCTGQFKNCARYQKTAKNHPVPPNLMPNGTLLNIKKK